MGERHNSCGHKDKEESVITVLTVAPALCNEVSIWEKSCLGNNNSARSWILITVFSKIHVVRNVMPCR